MTEAIMAHPDLRHPFEQQDVGNTPVVLFNNHTRKPETLGQSGLWVAAEDLASVNGFELKPEGACLGSLCIPIKADSPMLKEEGDRQWIDACAFADMIEQPYIADEDTLIWSFGDVPAAREPLMTNAMAPDFEVTDREGNVVRMADYKGKKALIITWSSW